MSNDDYEDIVSSLSPETKKVVLEVVKRLEKKIETTRTGELIHLEIASYRSDGYDERLLIDKLEEWKVLIVEAIDEEFGHPLVLASLEKIRKFKEALKKPSTEEILEQQRDEEAIHPNPITAKSVSEVADWGMEEFFEDEIQLINKLLQICNKETKWVILMHPAHLAESASDRAGFDKIEILKDLHKRYKVFRSFKPPIESIDLTHVGLVKAKINYQKLYERAESLHDEVESWKGIALGIEEQKKELMKRIKYDLNKFANDKTFTISENILGTYNVQISSKPLGFSLSRPDKNRPDINFEFMKALRALEKDGHFTIEEVDIDFNAQPRPTTEAVEKAKWSLGTREINEFYPPEHCTVTIRPKVLEIVRDAAKAAIQTIQANKGVLVEQVKQLQESGPTIAEAVKNAQQSAELLKDIRPIISTDTFAASASKSYEALLLEEQIEINRQILEKLGQRESETQQKIIPSSQRNLSKREISKELTTIKKTRHLGKKEKKLLILLEDFEPHKTRDLASQVPSTALRKLKESLQNKLEGTGFFIETIKGTGLNPMSFYQLKNLQYSKV